MMIEFTHNKTVKTLLSLSALGILSLHGLFADEKTSVELSLSLGYTAGCYKETTFSNITQDIGTPSFVLDTKIYSTNFFQRISASYLYAKPESVMTRTVVVYKDYDPVTGENYWHAFGSDLSFHKIQLQYDLLYKMIEREKSTFYIGGDFAVNSYMQFENYPSITGLFALGLSSAFKYDLDERNSLLFSASFPLAAYAVRPSYAGCDALLMKYADGIITYGKREPDFRPVLQEKQDLRAFKNKERKLAVHKACFPSDKRTDNERR